jgi:hypothetical protein
MRGPTPRLSVRVTEEIDCAPFVTRQDTDTGCGKHALYRSISQMEALLQELYGDALIAIKRHDLGACLFIDLYPNHRNPPRLQAAEHASEPDRWIYVSFPERIRCEGRDQ